MTSPQEVGSMRAFGRIIVDGGLLRAVVFGAALGTMPLRFGDHPFFESVCRWR